MEVVQPLRNKRDIDRMKKALNGRDRLLFIFGINSGLRISDILRLKVGDIRNKEALHLREKKTGKYKTFRFNASILAEVSRQDFNGDDDYVFKSRKGTNKPISRQQAYNILQGAAERCGIDEPLGCHTLRKTFGYHAYKAGVDLAIIQSIFNHASQAVTLRYIGITQDNVNDAYSAVCL
jgi:integrase